MLKWIAFLLLGVLLYRVLVRPGRRPPRPEARAGEAMVRCTQCALHIPESEALVSEGRPFCNRAHLDLWTRSR